MAAAVALGPTADGPRPDGEASAACDVGRLRCLRLAFPDHCSLWILDAPGGALAPVGSRVP